ncbi:MAG TPA: S1/P1 nuclease [Tepidisphaeraceae bacterium]|nr:S1/P1 nuclease [Tepidisphaeraceae bacterium]
MRNPIGVIILALIWPCTTALAWNPPGHMAIASIAYDQLSPAQQEAWVKLLRSHPRYAQDFEAAMPQNLSPEQQNRWIFMRAAAWPDQARSFDGDDQKYNHPIWHYIDRPVFLDEAAREKIHPPELIGDYHKAGGEQSMNAVQAINKALAELSDHATPASQRAVDLCWVLHLAGDLHQPLHGATLYSAERFRGILLGDRGGNDIPVHENEGLLANSRNPNLHAIWDNILGEDSSYDAVTARASKVEIAHPAQALLTAAQQTDPMEWAKESNQIAQRDAYTPEVREVVRTGEAHPHTPLPPVQISTDYLKRARSIAQERAALAGYRAAALLAKIEP